MTEQTSNGAGGRGTFARLIPVLIFAGIAAFFAFALTSGDPSKLPSALLGKPVPTTSFPGLEGADPNTPQSHGFTSENLKDGKVRVVNFWASWCGPCVEEHPYLTTLAKAGDVEIYGVNSKDSAVNARRYLSRYGNPYAELGTDESGRSAIEWGVYGTPETYIVNKQGIIIYRHIGQITDVTLTSVLLPKIAEAKAAAATSTPAQMPPATTPASGQPANGQPATP